MGMSVISALLGALESELRGPLQEQVPVLPAARIRTDYSAVPMALPIAKKARARKRFYMVTNEAIFKALTAGPVTTAAVAASLGVASRRYMSMRLSKMADRGLIKRETKSFRCACGSRTTRALWSAVR